METIMWETDDDETSEKLGMYGEMIPTLFQWMTPQEQLNRVRQLEMQTKQKAKKT